MNGCNSRRAFCGLLLTIAAIVDPAVSRADDAAELKLFQGAWVVVRLVEDGRVIPAEKIPEVLPSGGRIEVVDNAMLFVDAHTGQRHSRMIKLNPTTYPSTIDVSSAESADVNRGIYKFDQGQLIICISEPGGDSRPTELAAPAGSKAMLMVLQRRTATSASPTTTTPPARPAQAPQAVAAGPSDEQIRTQLPGVWRVPDQQGFLHIRFRDNGTFSTWRVQEKVQLFQRVFVEQPISSGSWEVRQGRIVSNVGSSVDPGRIGSSLLFTIKAMTATEFVFVDGLGRSNKAVRESPVSR